jgi:hypothetical protein
MWYTLCQRYCRLQTTVNTLNVTTSSVAVPSLTTSKTALDFSFEQNFSSAPLNYQITALTSDVMITSDGNFTISKRQLPVMGRL